MGKNGWIGKRVVDLTVKKEVVVGLEVLLAIHRREECKDLGKALREIGWRNSINKGT